MSTRSAPARNRGLRPGPVGLAVVIVFAVALAAYAVTVKRGLDYADNGELAGVAWTLGIAHPTGYPSITLLGHLFAHALPLRPILSLNLLAALLTAMSAGALVLLFDELLQTLKVSRMSGDSGARTRASLAALAALATAFSGTWWEQALRFEVYPLHALFVTLATFFFLRFVRRGDGGFAFGFVLGLAFTAHMTTILLAPGMLAYYALSRGFGGREIRRLVGLAPWFALGLTPYLYLPLRSAAGPRFDWSAPATLPGFVRMVTGREFGGWLFTDPGTFLPQWSSFFRRLPAETGYITLAVAIAGWVWLLARSKRLAALVALLIAASLIFAGGYGIPDIGPYFGLAVLGLGLSMATGLAWMLHRFGTRAALAVGALGVALALAFNLPRLLPEPDSAVEDFARDLLEPLPRRALVLSNQWDPWTSGSLYLQEVERLRPDVTVVDSEALGRSWYLGELRRRAASLCARIEPQIERVRGLTVATSSGTAVGTPLFETAYRELVDALISTSLRDRPVFVTRDAVHLVRPGLRTVPEGLAFRVLADTSDAPRTPARWRFDPRRATRDAYGALTCELYARSALDRAYYEAGRDRDSLALRWLALARSFDPSWRADRVAPQPWGATDMLGRSLGFFDALPHVSLGQLKVGGKRASS